MSARSAPPAVELSREVAAAIAEKRAVVALESTIISHGMPYPQNVETALRLEKTVRDHGAVPATIAVIDGRLRAGLEASDIDMLGKAGKRITKLSRRDIPVVIARRQHGATTVAATMIIAALAGIRVFATGGIGGVHRGVESTMDISADLEELGRTSVAVVCAGIKSILDLPRTVEYLETRGVPLIGFGTDALPAFYSRSSGLGVDCRSDSPAEIARMMRAKWQLGLDGGLVVTVPVPEEHAMPAAEIDAVIEEALAAMEEAGIGGKAATPFLLERIAARTTGRSLDANIALVLNNAAVAARIAVEYGKISGSGAPTGG